jgi:hypothetical protein
MDAMKDAINDAMNDEGITSRCVRNKNVKISRNRR